MLWGTVIAAGAVSHLIATAIDTSGANTNFNWLVPHGIAILLDPGGSTHVTEAPLKQRHQLTVRGINACANIGHRFAVDGFLDAIDHVRPLAGRCGFVEG